MLATPPIKKRIQSYSLNTRIDDAQENLPLLLKKLIAARFMNEMAVIVTFVVAASRFARWNLTMLSH